MTKCTLCADRYQDGGDGWDGLCPSCADRVSNYMDATGQDRDAAVQAFRNLAAGEFIVILSDTVTYERKRTITVKAASEDAAQEDVLDRADELMSGDGVQEEQIDNTPYDATVYGGAA